MSLFACLKCVHPFAGNWGRLTPRFFCIVVWLEIYLFVCLFVCLIIHSLFCRKFGSPYPSLLLYSRLDANIYIVCLFV